MGVPQQSCDDSLAQLQESVVLTKAVKSVMEPKLEDRACLREGGSAPKRGRHFSIFALHEMHLCSGSLVI